MQETTSNGEWVIIFMGRYGPFDLTNWKDNNEIESKQWEEEKWKQDFSVGS